MRQVIVIMTVLITASATDFGWAQYDTTAICGPRAVQRVMLAYGHSVDLFSLVREMQTRQSDGGASLADLERALHARGIATAARQVGRSVGIRWDYPVVLHLRGASGLAHFAVQMPSSSKPEPGPNDGVVIWLGPNDEREYSDDQIGQLRSGAVLLTAPTEIADADNAFHSFGWGASSWLVVVSFVILPFAVAAYLLYRASCKTQGLPGSPGFSKCWPDAL